MAFPKKLRPKLRQKISERLKRISAWGHILAGVGLFLAGIAVGSLFAGVFFGYALPLLVAAILLHLPAAFEVATAKF